MILCWRFVVLTVLLLPWRNSAFLSPRQELRSVASKTTIGLVDDDQEVLFGSSGVLDPADTIDTSIAEELKKRQAALKQGIGKLYVARTQKGFLNIHYEPTDPHDIDNVVGRLQEGQIVTSTGPTRGVWVPHDAGGWSIAKYAGFTWLEPIDE